MDILKVKDKDEKHYIKKNLLSSLPARILIVGKSQLSGKTNLLINLLCREGNNFYKDDFKGEHIYLISASIGTDDKLDRLINFKEIPDENLVSGYDEEILKEIYKEVEQKHKEEPKDHFLIILDDVSFSGGLKAKLNGIISRIFSNGRHINCSCILTSQKYTDILPSCRENMTQGIFFNCSNKQLDLITDDVNYLSDNKTFKKMFRSVMTKPHAFFVVNFFKPVDEMYMDQNFTVIKP
tara:strand:- start:864 stop:1577 length:714 start_codon:yes stop_codon:yes gene_type:complete